MLKKNLLFETTVLILLTIFICFCFSIFYNLGRLSNTKQSMATIIESGKIQIKVLEANTLSPIDNATVCIIETRHYENTNKNGITSLIEIPIIRNQNYDISLPQKWGNLTILVYKSGYADNISFNNCVFPSSTNIGTTIFLSPIINKADNTPTVSIDKPNNIWIQSLIKLYKK